jgi:hypothetical protein
MLKQVPQNEAIHDLATTETDLKRPTDTVVKVAEHQRRKDEYTYGIITPPV